MSVTISYPSTQFEELYGPFVNLWAHLPPKDNSPNIVLAYGSAAVSSFEKERALVVVRETSPEESNSLR